MAEMTIDVRITDLDLYKDIVAFIKSIDKAHPEMGIQASLEAIAKKHERAEGQDEG